MNERTITGIWLTKFAQESNFTPTQLKQLLKRFGADALVNTDCREWANQIDGARQWHVSAKRQRLLYDEATREAEAIGENMGALIWGESEYPTQLQMISTAPSVLFYKGNATLLDSEMHNTTTIVGSRRPSSYGLEVTKRITLRYVQIGAAIASGLALGVDKTAHEVALDVGGKTIAVLGSGLAEIYPASNKYLAERIVAEGGVIVSEYLPQTKPKAWQFPARNRILSALAMRIIVTEAQIKSGALITASIALEEGKPVYAVPGSILLPYSAGCNQLLQDGAIMLDLDTHLGMDGGGASNYGVNAVKHKSEEPWLELLAQYPSDPLMLSRTVGASISQISAWLVKMDLEGKVKFDRGLYHLTPDGWNAL